MNRAAEAVYAAICREPERADLREVFIDAVAEEDPAWSAHLRSTVRDKWLEHRAGPGADRLGPRFERFETAWVSYRFGLPYRLTVSPQVFDDHGEELLNAGPIVEVLLAGAQVDWKKTLPAILESRALPRVRHLHLEGNSFGLHELLQIMRAPNLDKLLALTTPEAFLLRSTSPADADLEAELWETILASPSRRAMIDWGLGLKPHAQRSATAPEAPPHTLRAIGDRVVVDEEIGRLTTRFEPMTETDRALERRHGYIPRLHAANWEANVLDVMRGLQPAFPAGTPVDDSMYAVPPPVIHDSGGYLF